MYILPYQYGVHRYKPNLFTRLLEMAPRYVEVPNRAVDMDSRALLACYPRGNFWLMIFADSINQHRFTKFWFPNCSTYPSRSKAGFWLYPIAPISIRS